MQVKLNQNHVAFCQKLKRFVDYKKGDTIDVNEKHGRRLIEIKAATQVKTRAKK